MLRKTELKNALEHIREVAHECGLSEEECKELLAEMDRIGIRADEAVEILRDTLIALSKNNKWWGTLICIGAGC